MSKLNNISYQNGYVVKKFVKVLTLGHLLGLRVLSKSSRVLSSGLGASKIAPLGLSVGQSVKKNFKTF